MDVPPENQGREGSDLPFRQLAQHLPVPCWIADRRGNIVWANDAWVAFTGKTAEDLAIEGLAVLHDPNVFPQVRARWELTRRSGTADEMTFPLRGRDGAFRPFQARVVPLRDADGQVSKWFGTNIDVSGQSDAEARAQQTEASLRENEARLRIATEAAGVGVWEWRLDTNEMVYSPQARFISGFAPDEPINLDMVVAVTHPEDLPTTTAQAARALDPEVRDAAPYEYRLVTPSGEVRWVQARGEAIFESQPDGSAVATRYIGAITDITERKLAEEALRAREQGLTLALKAGRMVPWQVSAAGELRPSSEMNLLIGLPADARPVIAALIPNYLPGELDRIAAAADEARARGEPHFEIEYQYRRPDGEVRWYAARAEAQTGPSGAPNGTVGVVMDITERKTNEDRVQFLAREVDHRSNNLLSIVQSAVALSRAESIDDLRRVITGRVHALAHAHQLLAEARWAGADLRRLAEEELLPYSLGDGQPRVRIDGPQIALAPAAAQGVAMVLHELATNATKHGALSVDAGSVELTWRVEEPGRLCVRWIERGGPPVTAPTRQGLGVSVIGRAVGGPVGGATTVHWLPTGLVCEIELPWKSDA